MFQYNFDHQRLVCDFVIWKWISYGDLLGFCFFGSWLHAWRFQNKYRCRSFLRGLIFLNRTLTDFKTKKRFGIYYLFCFLLPWQCNTQKKTILFSKSFAVLAWGWFKSVCVFRFWCLVKLWKFSFGNFSPAHFWKWRLLFFPKSFGTFKPAHYKNMCVVFMIPTLDKLPSPTY